jgi:SPP1 family predicted phage head-tail adaptor
MNPGSRDRRIEIEFPTSTLDDFGGEVITWSTIGKKWWSNFYPLKDSEVFRNSEATATITHRFQLDWTNEVWSQIDPRCRIKFDGRIYDVVGIKEIGRRQGIDISATARAENG